jgi:hypothetical protein
MHAKIGLGVISLIGVFSTNVFAQQPYPAQVGDKAVTSVSRPVTKGAGSSKNELLGAARTAVPAKPRNSGGAIHDNVPKDGGR